MALDRDSPVAPRLGLANSLGELLRLLRHAHGESRRKLVFAIGATGLAALADIAALALLQHAASGLFQHQQAGQGPSGTGALAGFLGAALAGSILRFWAQRETIIAQYAIANALSVEAFRILQHQDYADYVTDGASEGFATFDRLQLVCFNALAPFISGAAALLSIAALLVALIVFYPISAGFIAAGLLLFALSVRGRGTTAVAAGLSALARQRARLLFEARSAFRDIFLINGQDRICEDFAAIEGTIRRNQARAILGAQSSRHSFEITALGLGLVVLLAFPAWLAKQSALLPVLGILALAGLRLLPQFAIMRSAIRLIGQHGDVTGDVLALFERPQRSVGSSNDAPHLSGEVALRGVVVRRGDRPDTLRELDFVIPRGARIGIVGASGAGKSTLLDVICGATEPDAGSVSVDGTTITPANGAAWRNRIGVVSQHTVVLGRTLREVVTYPERLGEADTTRFDAAVGRAGVRAMAGGFPSGLDTDVGETLGKLSGGQRQRLALAHALYRARDLLVLDEATGQLDEDSERAIIETIRSLPPQLTVILVTHRPALLECCTQTYRLAKGRLTPEPSDRSR